MKWLEGIEGPRERKERLREEEQNKIRFKRERQMQAWDKLDALLMPLLDDLGHKLWGRKWLGIAPKYRILIHKPRSWTLRCRKSAYRTEYWIFNLDLDREGRICLNVIGDDYQSTDDLTEAGVIRLLQKAYESGPNAETDYHLQD